MVQGGHLLVSVWPRACHGSHITAICTAATRQWLADISEQRVDGQELRLVLL